jgi:BirA family biotin operon repressor/biotin-[acetyl-CoA-carboxylase] ligase
MLNISELKEKLKPTTYSNTHLNVLFKNHVSSTNDYLNYQYARDLFPLLVVTNSQRAARGRNKKTWVSMNQKSISFSLCFKVNAKHVDLRYLSYLSCTCLLSAMKEINYEDIKIKWPNDLYLNNKKVSGILIESLSINKEFYVSVGIGVNLDIPKNCSIGQPYSNLGKNIDQASLISIFGEALFKNIDKINMSKVIEFYNKNLYWYKQRVSIKDNNDYFEGELLGINEQGQLMIQNNGNIERIDNINSTMRRL